MSGGVLDDLDITPRTLRNRGVPVRLARLSALPIGDARAYDPGVLARAGIRPEDLPMGPLEVVRDDDGDPITEVVYLRFTNNVLADMEERYGAVAAWQELSQTKPVSTTRATMAMMLERDEREVGLAMLEGEIIAYQGAIGVAWALANGLDPTRAELLLRSSAESVAVLRERNSSVVEKLVDDLQETSLEPEPATA